MKKFIFILSSLAMLVATSNFTQAQEPKQSAKEKREARKAQQAAQEAVYQGLLTTAFTNQEFSFIADYFSAGAITRQSVMGGFRSVDVSAKYLIVRLPYVSTTRDLSSTPLVIDFQTADYEYTYELKKGVHYIKINARNVRNNQSESKIQNGSYIFNFQVSGNGSAIVNVSPTYMAPITFYGTISLK